MQIYASIFGLQGTVRTVSVMNGLNGLSLPLEIRSAPTLSAFKNVLKTHLFSRYYFTD